VTAIDDAPVTAAPGRTAEVVRAEKAVLGSMIASARAAEELLDRLGPDDAFGEPHHRAVYAAVRHVTEDAPLGEPGSLAAGPQGDASVQRRFTAVLGRLVAAESGIWRTSEAGVILGDLAGHATPGWRADAAEVLRAAVQRRTVAAVDAMRRAVSAPGFDGAEDGDLLRKLLDNALGGPVLDTGAATAADLFLETLQRLESAEPPGTVQFPWTDLRDIVPWLRPGQLVTIAARPSFGKSQSANDIVRHTGIKLRLPVVLFTMEMGRDEVMDRLVSAESGVAHDRIVASDLDDLAWDRIAAAQERFAESKILIDDTPKATLAHIRARLRGMARTEPAQLAVIDYLQLMQSGQGENRQQEVSALVSGLKAVAREFRIPVLMLCQLNRGPEHRQDKRPLMSDARESGAVENDSDIVILIHREDMYDLESPKAGQADLIVGKNRGGHRGTATVGFQGNYARFVDLAYSPSAKHAEDA
jgi:replicative DNA helicase